MKFTSEDNCPAVYIRFRKIIILSLLMSEKQKIVLEVDLLEKMHEALIIKEPVNISLFIF